MIRKIIYSVVPFIAAMSLASCSTMNNSEPAHAMKSEGGACMMKMEKGSSCGKSCCKKKCKCCEKM